MREGRAILSCAGHQPASGIYASTNLASANPALSFHADHHRDACHIIGNKGARSGSARSNVTIVVNRSVSLRSPRQTSHRDHQNASIHAVKPYCGTQRTRQADGDRCSLPFSWLPDRHKYRVRKSSSSRARLRRPYMLTASLGPLEKARRKVHGILGKKTGGKSSALALCSVRHRRPRRA